jgi:hypothetical protein
LIPSPELSSGKISLAGTLRVIKTASAALSNSGLEVKK